MIKPRPLRPPVEGGFTVDDFTVSEEQGTVTCPAGHTVPLSRTRVATFGVLCRNCPLRERCTTCKTGHLTSRPARPAGSLQLIPPAAGRRSGHDRL